MLKYIIIYVSITVLPLVIKFFIQKKYKSSLSQKKALEALELEKPKYYYESIFIGPENMNCNGHFREGIECGETCSLVYLRRLLTFISSAKSSISLCMYCLSLRDLRFELMKAHERGIKVRIITDKEMMMNRTSKVWCFRKKGIPVKVQPSNLSLMHHKFCLIDECDENCAKMFLGSANLTGQGIVRNVEHILLTNNQEVIQRFSEEFEILWNSFTLI